MDGLELQCAPHELGPRGACATQRGRVDGHSPLHLLHLPISPHISAHLRTSPPPPHLSPSLPHISAHLSILPCAAIRREQVVQRMAMGERSIAENVAALVAILVALRLAVFLALRRPFPSLNLP